MFGCHVDAADWTLAGSWASLRLELGGQRGSVLRLRRDGAGHRHSLGMAGARYGKRDAAAPGTRSLRNSWSVYKATRAGEPLPNHDFKNRLYSVSHHFPDAGGRPTVCSAGPSQAACRAPRQLPASLPESAAVKRQRPAVPEAPAEKAN